MMFAFLAIPFCGAIGLAVDMGRIYHVNMATQSALDAAALAAGRVAQVEKKDTIDESVQGGIRIFRRRSNRLMSSLQVSRSCQIRSKPNSRLRPHRG